MLFIRIRSAWFGMSLPYHAARLILSKRILLFWSLFPVTITLLLYTYLIRFLQSTANEYMERYFHIWGMNPEGWTVWIISIFTNILLLLVAALTFTFSSSIVASPFNDFLAEKTENFATPRLSIVPKKSLIQQIKLIGVDLLKTIASVVVSFLAILLSWIPIINLVIFVLLFLLVCFQYTSYPQTRRGIGLKSGLHFLWQHFFACSAFGATMTIFFAIPLLSMLTLPIAVVGGTLLVARAPGGEKLHALK